jgi:hypothetical protein
MSHRLRPASVGAAALTALILTVPTTAIAKRHTPPRGTRVVADLLPTSAASVSIPAVALPGGTYIIGTDSTDARSIPLSGRLAGVIPGGFRLGKSNKLTLRSGRVGLGAADLLTDKACGGASVLRTDPTSAVTVDPAAPSTARIAPNGQITAAMHLVLRLAVLSRMQPGCDAGLVPMGYATTAFTVGLHGQIARDGLNKVELLSDQPVQFTAAVCLTPGSPNGVCATPPAGYPVAVGVDVAVKLTLPSAP